MDEPQNPAPSPIIQVQIVPRTLSADEQAIIDQAVQQFVTETDKTANSMTFVAKFLLWTMGFFFVSWLFFMFALLSRH